MKHTVVSDNEITLAIQLHERTTPSLKPNPMNSYNVAQNINSVPFDVAYSHSVDEMKPYTSTYTQVLLFLIISFKFYLSFIFFYLYIFYFKLAFICCL